MTSWAHLVDLRHLGHARATAPTWEVKEVVYASGSTDDSGLSDAALEHAHDLDTSAPAAARGARRARPRPTLDGARASEVEPTARRLDAAAGVEPAASARRRPPSTSTSSRTRTRSSVSRARPTTSPCTRSRRGGKERPARATRAASTASRTKLRNTFGSSAPAALRHRPGPAGRSSRRPEPGQAPPTPEADPNQPVISRDHGARPRRRPLPGRACSPIFSGLMFAAALR